MVIVFWDLDWGPPSLGSCHLQGYSPNSLKGAIEMIGGVQGLWGYVGDYMGEYARGY